MNGICTCATCGAKVPIKSAHAGHFISRKHLATRFHEKNVHAQCFACNIHRGGEQYAHSLHIDKTYGTGTAILLHEMSREIIQMKAHDYMEIEDTYRAKISALIFLDKKE